MTLNSSQWRIVSSELTGSLVFWCTEDNNKDRGGKDRRDKETYFLVSYCCRCFLLLSMLLYLFKTEIIKTQWLLWTLKSWSEIYSVHFSAELDFTMRTGGRWRTASERGGGDRCRVRSDSALKWGHSSTVSRVSQLIKRFINFFKLLFCTFKSNLW